MDKEKMQMRAVPVELIKEALELAAFGEWQAYLDVAKMEIVSVPDDLSLYGDGDVLEDLEADINQYYGRRYFSLPDDSAVKELVIMKRFVSEMPAGEAKSFLEAEMSERGAVIRFREGVRDLGIEQEWKDYKAEFYRQVARDWCETNGLEYEE